jgi:hypothetical protein
MNKTAQPLHERLKNGAKKLGEIWKNPADRCATGWSLDTCTCQPEKRFCRVRQLWVTLAIEAGRDLDDGPFGLALAMTAEEWDETQAVMKVTHPEIGEILVGTGQGKMTRMQDLLSMMSAPEVLKDTLKVMKTFPNSRVVGVEESATPAPAAALAVAAANPDEAFE